MRTKISLIAIGLLICISARPQVQKGEDILNNNEHLHFGSSMSMSDADHIAIGAPSTESEMGRVGVYEWMGESWIQKGSDLTGPGEEPDFGASICLPDQNTLGVGTPSWDSNELGYVRIYSWNGEVWTQKGDDIFSENVGDLFGVSISMPDINTVAIAGPHHSYTADGVDYEWAGKVSVYVWEGESWVLKGPEIIGEIPGAYFGSSISMPDENTIGIGAKYNSENGIYAGQVRLYTWDGTAWVDKGAPIDGEGAGDRSGTSVSMPDEDHIAIGAPENIGSIGYYRGHVRVFSWNGTEWSQKGADIDGQDETNDWGHSVSMPDNNTIAIGAYNTSVNGPSSGQARVYKFDGSNWVQEGETINGENPMDRLGEAVYMPDANTMACSVPHFEIDQTDFGLVRVFEFIPLGLGESDGGSAISAYPNPTSGMIRIETNNTGLYSLVQVYGLDGKILDQIPDINADSMLIDLSKYDNGIYFVKLTGRHTSEMCRVVKY